MPDLDPKSALLPGRFDPAALLSLWCLRKTAFPLLWIGFIGSVLAGQFDRIGDVGFDSVSETVSTLFSPLAGLILGLGVRLVARWLGFLLAYRLIRSTALSRPEGDLRTRVIALADEFRATSAYRTLRWTTPVREEAASRLGRAGERFMDASRFLTVANVVLFLAMVVAIVAFVD